jgi:hypothetical protein
MWTASHFTNVQKLIENSEREEINFSQFYYVFCSENMNEKNWAQEIEKIWFKNEKEMNFYWKSEFIFKF